MDPIDTSLTARASSALFNQVMREQQAFSAPYAASGPVINPRDLVSVAPLGPNASPQDFNEFMRKLVEAKQKALREAAQRGGGTRPTDPNGPSQKTGPLNVTAHGFYEGQKFVPVKEIRIYEVGDYSHRTHQTFGGNWQSYSWKMRDARVGQSYKVKVTWANGYSEIRDVRMNSASGANLTIYKY